MQSKVDLNRKVRALVALATGLEPMWVSPANQSLDVPEPPQVWATVLINIFGPVGMDEVSYANAANNQVAETVEGSRLCSASIQFFRVGANDLANRFKTRVRMSNAVEYMRANDIGFVSIGDVQDVTAVEREDWEERSQLTLMFHTSITDMVELDTYGSFDFTIYRDNPNAQFSFTVNEPAGDSATAITTESGDVMTTETGETLEF